MSARFGWCTTGHHNACPVQVSSATGGLRCGCICHDPAACGDEQKGSEIGRIPGKTKGRIALTNPTLLATISTQPKGA